MKYWQMILAGMFLAIFLFGFGNAKSGNITYSCYQETANQSSIGDGSCGLNYSGNYRFNGTWYDINNAYDGSWITSASPFNCNISLKTGDMYINYSIPLSASTPIWQIKDDSTNLFNLTIPNSCLQNNILATHIKINTKSDGPSFCDNLGSDNITYSCFNSTNEIILLTNTGRQSLYEEAIIWNITNAVTLNLISPLNNSYIINGTQNFSVFYNYSMGIGNMTLDIFNEANYCYQEDPRIVPACSNAISGYIDLAYEANPAIACNRSYDNNWSSQPFSNSRGVCDIYEYYKTPSNAIGAIIQYKGIDSAGMKNFTTYNKSFFRANFSASTGNPNADNVLVLHKSNVGTVLALDRGIPSGSEELIITNTWTDGFYEDGVYWIVPVNSTTTSFGAGNTTGILGTLVNLVSGVYTWFYTMIDNAGNTFTSETFTLNLNTAPSPTVLLISPDNNTASGVNKTFICNATDNYASLSNMTLYVWNSTGSLNSSLINTTSGMANQSSFVFTFPSSDTYTWNCLATNNLSYSSSAQSNYTLIVDIFNPVTNLNFPADNQWLKNGTNVDFNCTTIEANLGAGMLFGNFSGVYGLNKTLSSITTNVMYNFKLNLTDGSYLWTCGVNRTSGATVYMSQVGNKTVNIDTIIPVVSNLLITTTAGSQTFIYDSNITDLHLSSCKYSIFNDSGAIDGLNNNVSFTCNVPSSATTTAYGNYNFTIYGTDLAGNEGSYVLPFYTSASSGGSTGGGGTTVIIIGNLTWTMQTEQYSKSYSLLISSGSTRTKSLLFQNTGANIVNLKLTCEGTLCKYLTLSSTNVSLPVKMNIYSSVPFTIVFPSNITSDTYTANIIATDSSGNKQIVSVDGVVSSTGIIIDTLNKLGTNASISGVQVPYLLIFLGVGALAFIVLFYWIFRKSNMAFLFAGIIAFSLAVLSIALI